MIAGSRLQDLTATAAADAGQLRPGALHTWVAHAGRFEPRLTVATWNGEPVLGGGAARHCWRRRASTAITWQ